MFSIFGLLQLILGVQEIHPVGELSAYEQDALKSMIPELNSSIESGVKFASEAS